MNKPHFFASPNLFREWLHANHEHAAELVVGFYKKGSGKLSMTWSQSVDEALCYGWIDGVLHSLGDDSYTIRFTPRRPMSIWSNVNSAKVGELLRLGRMMPSGLAAWERRRPEKSGVYAFEQRDAAAFDAAAERQFRRHTAAWRYFQAQPHGYRQLATHYVVSAKRPETRERRLSRLIERSAVGERLPGTVSSRRK